MMSWFKHRDAEPDRVPPVGFGGCVEAPPTKVILMSSPIWWDIIKEVAKGITVAHAMGGYEYCIFCNGRDNIHHDNFKHDDTCIVVKARALMVLRESEGS
jgi:hypothetical protein